MPMNNRQFEVQEASANYQLTDDHCGLRKGYKQTEVGVIPEDWNAKSLGSLTTLMTNGFVGTATSAYVNSEDGVLYIQGYNVEPNGFNLHGIKRVSKSFHNRNQKSCLRTGDLLTIQTGDIGVTTIVPPYLEGANCHALVISRFDKRHSESGFYCQYFNSERGHLAFMEIETGSTMKHLNVGDMVRLFVPSPPIAEQRAIATALSDVDALLAKLDQLIAKKRDLKQAAMQQLLTGQTRLPGFSGEWEVKRLGDMATFYKGKGQAKSDLGPYGSEPCIHYGELFTKYPESIYTTLSYTNLTAGVFRSIANDVLMPTSDVTPNGLATASCIHQDKVILGGDILVIRADPSILNGSFISYVIRQLRDQVMQLVTGTTVFHLYGTDMKKFTFSMPSVKEQCAIVNILDDIDTEITQLETRRDKTRALKQGMMQELLTGRIRLPL
ncbi:MAG: hypothetical protein HOP23_05915 [Methylococcaceae bacterium]|nr:hypothetical protein [Methylococcaceae bacterium]